MEEKKPHFLLVSFPAQGHINPSLQFAKRLLQAGARVTFCTTVSAHRRMEKANNTLPRGLTFAAISDGYDDVVRPRDVDVQTYFSRFRQRGSETLAELLEKSAAMGNHVTCLVYTLLLPWAAQVASGFNTPSALLWIQPATVFDVYYYYFNGYKDVIRECEKDPSWSLKLPNLPFELKALDLPSLVLPSAPSSYTFSLTTFQEHVKELDKEENPMILVNTFEALEADMLRSIEKFKLIPVGPLLPSAFLDGKDPLDKSFGGDLFPPSKDGDYMEWLNSQKKYSVVYVSFGSMSMSALSKSQMEEVARAVIQTRRPFLWVKREKETEEKEKQDQETKQAEEENEELSCMGEVRQQGLLVPWCSQLEVLSHPSVGCFVTHCGWNSTLESLTSSVPMVAFPQWTDQTTNAKLVQDVWKTGVRVSEEEGLVKGEEIRRCLEVVMESEEMRENAKRWRDLAIQASKEGGSSYRNLKAFIKHFCPN
ncbi:LOW QUALITY PROTEIN: hypothetical protein Cgig2_001340 [Carnegiea gigantea]|uniref:Glycosyltransferase n=1 Tax=Carnegiea gigantea TaxID=171969 RepID=A0A9Q1QPT5_9CARY|nr:LOW QUALITY PROTEIN: hypothetical protein Cgig2_001340 [Carnegiea gigantea]